MMNRAQRRHHAERIIAPAQEKYGVRASVTSGFMIGLVFCLCSVVGLITSIFKSSDSHWAVFWAALSVMSAGLLLTAVAAAKADQINERPQG